MTNIFLPDAEEIVYITVQDVKDSTSKAEIAALTDAEIQELIYKAEVDIDEYIWPFAAPYVDWQPFVFPIEDSEWIVPNDINIACLYTLEYIYVLWDTITSWWTSWWAVIEESIWDHKVKYSEWVTASSSGLKIPKEAKSLLSKYRQTFCKSIV